MIAKIIDSIPRLLCSLLTVSVILWLTLAPRPVGEMEVPLFPGADKLVHALMFGFLTWMLHIDTGKMTRRTPGAVATMMCAVAATLFGALTEWLQQSMQAGRTAEAADLMADAAGAALVCILILMLRFRKTASGSRG